MNPERTVIMSGALVGEQATDDGSGANTMRAADEEHLSADPKPGKPLIHVFLLLLLPLQLLLGAVGCDGPLVVFPGGRIDGEVRPAPPAWGDDGEYGFAQLETRPEEPYSVNIAYTIHDGALYVNAGDTETQWVKNMTANPNVRMRIDGTLYALTAQRVDDEAEIARFGEAWVDQSLLRRDPAELDEVWLYRMAPR
jgi:hypothetical protein